jgi:hypothetical protein
MKNIEISREHYEAIVNALEISGSVYGTISDFCNDDYKKDLALGEDTLQYLLGKAKDFDFQSNIEEDEELGVFLKEEYSSPLLDVLLDEYDPYIANDFLSRELAKRDMRNTYTKEKIDVLVQEHHGYLGVPLYDFEEKYYDEFDEHGFERLYIRE